MIGTRIVSCILLMLVSDIFGPVITVQKTSAIIQDPGTSCCTKLVPYKKTRAKPSGTAENPCTTDYTLPLEFTIEELKERLNQLGYPTDNIAFTETSMSSLTLDHFHTKINNKYINIDGRLIFFAVDDYGMIFVIQTPRIFFQITRSDASAKKDYTHTYTGIPPQASIDPRFAAMRIFPIPSRGRSYIVNPPCSSVLELHSINDLHWKHLCDDRIAVYLATPRPSSFQFMRSDTSYKIQLIDHLTLYVLNQNTVKQNLPKAAPTSTSKLKRYIVNLDTKKIEPYLEYINQPHREQLQLLCRQSAKIAFGYLDGNYIHFTEVPNLPLYKYMRLCKEFHELANQFLTQESSLPSNDKICSILQAIRYL